MSINRIVEKKDLETEFKRKQEKRLYDTIHYTVNNNSSFQKEGVAHCPKEKNKTQIQLMRLCFCALSLCKNTQKQKLTLGKIFNNLEHMKKKRLVKNTTLKEDILQGDPNFPFEILNAKCQLYSCTHPLRQLSLHISQLYSI